MTSERAEQRDGANSVDHTTPSSIKSDTKAFAELSTVDGITFLHNSTHWLETCFWLFLLISGLYLTVTDTKSQVDLYVDEDSRISMEAANLESLSFPGAKLCVNYNPSAFSVSSLPVTSSIDPIQRLYDGDKDLIASTLKLLSLYGLLENAAVDDLHSVNESAPLLEQLRRLYVGKHISVARLWRVVGNLLCHRWQTSITSGNKPHENELNPCAEEKISWLGVIPFSSYTTESTVCVDVGEMIRFEGMTDIIHVSVKPKALYDNIEGAKQVDEKFPIGAYLDFSGDPVSSDLTSDFVKFPTQGCKMLMISVEYELRLLNKRRKPCDEEAVSYLSCYGNCKTLTFRAGCSCYPDSWYYLLSNSSTPSARFCFETYSLQDYINCSIKGVRGSPLGKTCRDKCPGQCSFRQLMLIMPNGECADAPEDPTASVLELNPRKFVKQVFQEQLSKTPSELFSNFGGSIGLWLGAGLMGLFHVVLTLVRVLFKLLCWFSDSVRRACHRYSL